MRDGDRRVGSNRATRRGRPRRHVADKDLCATGCGRYGQEFYVNFGGKLCRRCQRELGITPPTAQELDQARLMRRYPIGSVCRLDPRIYKRVTTGFVPGQGRVEFEVVWDGT